MVSLDQLGLKPGTGSARTANGVPLHEAFNACTEHLVSHGGHAAAAGLRIEERNVDAFRAALCDFVASRVTAADRIAEVVIDAESPFSQLTLATVRQIEQLAPFGAGNPRPVLLAGRVQLAEPPRRMGSGERHLSVRFQQHGVAMRGVGFGQGDAAEELAQVGGPLDIVYRPVINDFRGRQTVEVHLVDWRPAGSS
jgi:single-stranded-DNA-specific exonuclease